MASSNITTALAALDQEIAELDERLEQLKTSRKVLALSDAEVTKSVRAKARKAETVEEDDDEDEAPAPRRSRRTATKGKAKSKRSASSNGDVTGESKADRIRTMLKDKVSPRDIAEELGVNVRYVYGVRRNAA